MLDPSCKSVKGFDSEGVERNYGDVSDSITTAALEAMQFATITRYYLAQAAESQGDPFDQYRTTQAFNTFQGTFSGDTIPEVRLNEIVGGTVNGEVVLGYLQKFANYAADSDAEEAPLFICGDEHLEKAYQYANDNDIEDITGAKSWQYYDNIIDEWWPVEEGACQDVAGDVTITHMGSYIQICSSTFS